jgi:flavin reductase (DIM6/NTAB) family NADH-FMN oxidoreductase RutF
MFYRPQDGHGLPHNPFKAVVSPRPIAWVSTRSAHGDNLAPYSFFNAITDAPPQVMFAGGMKDSIANASETGVFAVNVVEEAMFHPMSATSCRAARMNLPWWASPRPNAAPSTAPASKVPPPRWSAACCNWCP